MKKRTGIILALFSAATLFPSNASLAQSEILGHTYLGTFNGHAYYMSDCPTAWYDALYAAEAMGGYLATITSQAEDDFLAAFAPVINCETLVDQWQPWENLGDQFLEGGAWINLLTNDNDQDGICTMSSWMNGEPLVYTNWSDYYDHPLTGFCGPAGIIGYPSGVYYCVNNQDYGWFTNTYTETTSRYIVEFDGDPGCSNPNKTYVCHNGMTICVNNDAVQAHLNHGDYAGPCGPCNQNYARPDVDFTPETFGSIDHVHATEVHTFLNDDDSVADFNIFPNPVGSTLHVRLPHDVKEAAITITSLSGTGMLVEKSNTSSALDISSLPAGCYLISVQAGDKQFQKRIVKF